MTKYYSAQENGFFDSDIHGENMPGDIVAISETEYSEIIEGQSLGKIISADSQGKPILSDRPVPEVNLRRQYAKSYIDNAAGNARQRFVSTGQLIDMEYKLAQEQTIAWRAAGSPAEDVPPAISDWAAAAGLTDEEAAADIEATAAAWEQVLITVRQIRLAGKAAVDAATDQGTADDMANVAQPYIDQLDSLAP
ncbi:hypothetical protein [Methylophaga sp. OBS4]|uniref:hypothetical protein n=1 Tax=Methylophaga sp. OBS4 TaxID=2991935 RepID=UPI00225BDC0F|nr:hypothetical protein [Methylophaga sp. OBS4]MCX4187159.1 hypothetical protein [Methylophaga sp. OBS4]